MFVGSLSLSLLDVVGVGVRFFLFFLIWNTNCLPVLVNLIQGHVSRIQEGGKKRRGNQLGAEIKGETWEGGSGNGLGMVRFQSRSTGKACLGGKGL